MWKPKNCLKYMTKKNASVFFFLPWNNQFQILTQSPDPFSKFPQATDSMKPFSHPTNSNQHLVFFSWKKSQQSVCLSCCNDLVKSKAPLYNVYNYSISISFSSPEAASKHQLYNNFLPVSFYNRLKTPDFKATQYIWLERKTALWNEDLILEEWFRLGILPPVFGI